MLFRSALGLTNSNPLTDAFAANGAGYDRLLDSVSAVITPAGASSNIEIGLRVQAANEGAQPPTAQFTSNQKPPCLHCQWFRQPISLQQAPTPSWPS